MQRRSRESSKWRAAVAASSAAARSRSAIRPVSPPTTTNETVRVRYATKVTSLSVVASQTANSATPASPAPTPATGPYSSAIRMIGMT